MRQQDLPQYIDEQEGVVHPKEVKVQRLEAYLVCIDRARESLRVELPVLQHEDVLNVRDVVLEVRLEDFVEVKYLRVHCLAHAYRQIYPSCRSC